MGGGGDPIHVVYLFDFVVVAVLADGGGGGGYLDSYFIITFLCCHFNDMVNPTPKIPEVGVLRPEWRAATLHLYVSQCTNVRGKSCTRYRHT